MSQRFPEGTLPILHCHKDIMLGVTNIYQKYIRFDLIVTKSNYVESQRFIKRTLANLNCHKDIMKHVTNIYQKLYQLVRYMSQRQYKLCNKDFPKNTMQFLVVTKIQFDMSQVYSNITPA